jgi:DNA mismatch repair protein MutS2
VADLKVKQIKKKPLAPKTKAQKQKAKVIEKQQQEIIKKVEKEVLKKVVEVRKEKKIEAAKIAKEKSLYVYQINDRVKIIGSNAVGTIDKIDKKSVTINYGIFTTKTSPENIELVEKAKK